MTDQYPDNEHFNVYFIYPDDSNTIEREHLSPMEAIEFAAQAIRRPAAQMGIIKAIIITDVLDCCVFHWKHGEGIVFPKPNLQQIQDKGKTNENK